MRRILISLSLILIVFALVVSKDVQATSMDDLQKQINDLQQKVAVAQTQERTLSSQIELINNKISIQKLQIESTQDKIDQMTVRISSLSGKIKIIGQSLEHNSDILVHRIQQTYIEGTADPVFFLLTANNFSDLVLRLEHLQLAQKQDKRLLEQMALTKKNYSDQKTDMEAIKMDQEKLVAQLKALQVELVRQNSEKQSLLVVTKNNEATYQQLLRDAQRELEAIKNSQFTGKRAVKKGEVIGLMGSTGFSSGPHLHFGVYNLSESDAASFIYSVGTNNPLSFLSNRTIVVDSGACYDKSGSTSLGSGSWDWPMSGPRISQCFGKTPYSFVYANGLHDGLDMYDNGDVMVRAVDDGNAYFYRGNTAFGNNVRIFHSNGKMTLYLHLQ